MITFKALIDGVHFDPKKGTVKIQLVATSYVSMDKLITLGPRDESIQITLESLQTKIDVFPLGPDEANPVLAPDKTGEGRSVGELEEQAEAVCDELEAAEDKLEEAKRNEDAGERLKEASEELLDPVEDEDEVEAEGGGQGGII